MKKPRAHDLTDGHILAVAVVGTIGADEVYVLRQQGDVYRWTLVADEIAQVTLGGNTFAQATQALRTSCAKRLHKLVVC